MAQIRGEFGDVVDEFEELGESITLGGPIPKSLASEMVVGGVYLYTGTEPGYTAGHVYYYVNGTLTDGGVYGGTAVDATLSQPGQAADAKKTGDEISQIKEDLSAVKVDARIVYGETELHPSLYPIIGYTINSDNNWQLSSYVKCYLIPISKNAEYKVTNNNAAEGYIAFVKDGWFSNREQPHFATGETGRIIIPANGGEYKAIPPEDAEILVVQLIDRNSQNVMPEITVKEVASTARTIEDNMMWSWWIYPTMQSFSKIRNKIYWTFTSATGDAGIASYDYRSKATKRTVLNHVDDVDDHTGIAMKVLASGKIICAYSTGHNTDNFMHVRVSKIAEDISDFEEAVNLESSEDGNTTYAQLFTYAATGQKGKIYLFYRAASGHTWACRISADYGATWGEEIPIITSENQYYCRFTETTTRGVLRICMMSNPNANDRSIRQAFLHLATMEVYDSDNTTLLGTTNVDCTRVSVLIGLTSGYDTQRLFDVAVTDIGQPKILYAPFNLSESSDSVYKLYNNGATVTICNGGLSLWNPKYQLGACFKGKNEILVARNDNGVDCIEKYGDDGTLKKTYYREFVANQNIRNFRPVCDVNGKAWAYLRGYYNPETYKEFNSDAVLMAYADL
jgi:hypothetical protein